MNWKQEGSNNLSTLCFFLKNSTVTFYVQPSNLWERKRSLSGNIFELQSGVVLLTSFFSLPSLPVSTPPPPPHTHTQILQPFQHTCLKYINHEVAHIPPQFPFSAPPHVFPIPNNSLVTTNFVAILWHRTDTDVEQCYIPFPHHILILQPFQHWSQVLLKQFWPIPPHSLFSPHSLVHILTAIVLLHPSLNLWPALPHLCHSLLHPRLISPQPLACSPTPLP